jgi:6,7-dimethyl-8-ribityllumazine synthase
LYIMFVCVFGMLASILRIPTIKNFENKKRKKKLNMAPPAQLVSVCSDVSAKKPYRFALVTTQWNKDHIAEMTKLVRKAAMEARHEAKIEIHEFVVPGAWEIPPVVCRLLATKQYHAILPIGLVFGGDTKHDDMADPILHALMNLALEAALDGMTVLNGIIHIGFDKNVERKNELVRARYGSGTIWFNSMVCMIQVLESIPGKRIDGIGSSSSDYSASLMKVEGT